MSTDHEALRSAYEAHSPYTLASRQCPTCKGRGEVINTVFMDDKYDELITCPECKGKRTVCANGNAGYLESFRWHDFLKAGYTKDDLVLVMRWLQWMIKREKRRKESFRLYNLLDLEKFPYDLEDARGWARRPQQTPRAKFLESVGRPEPEKDNMRPVSELIDELRKTVQ